MQSYKNENYVSVNGRNLIRSDGKIGTPSPLGEGKPKNPSTPLRVTPLSDAELIAAFHKEPFDSRYIVALFGRYEKPLREYLYRLLKNTALVKDAMQMTFESAWNKIKNGQYKERGQFDVWLSTIAYHKAMDLLDEENQFVHPDDEVMEKAGGMEMPVLPGNDNKELFRILKTALRKLGCRERTILVLRFFRNRSFKEISLRMGISYNGVTSLYSKGLKQMRLLLI